MRNWFGSMEDPKEMFPIENLPIETWSEEKSDALTLLYRPQNKDKTGPPNKRHLLLQRGLDEEKQLFFKRILPIMDGFDNIFRHANSQNIEGDEILSNWLKTLETLYRRLLSALEKEGLVRIESKGKLIDFSKHEVVGTREVPGVNDNTVVEEVVRGYMYGNRVLRDSKVIVAKSQGNTRKKNTQQVNYSSSQDDTSYIE